MYWMRHIAVVCFFALCLIGIDTEPTSVASTVGRAVERTTSNEAAFVMHRYSDMALTERVEGNAPTVRLLQRIPAGKSSSRTFTGRTGDHATGRTPIFNPYGGRYRLPAVTTNCSPTELSRLCRLII